MTYTGLVLSPTAPLQEVSEDEQGLVARLVASDPAAIGEVYDEHHRAVRAFATRLVGDASAAEDLVHEVFVALPRAMRGYRFESSVRTFLISIAVNHARHHVRSATRRRAAMSRLGLEPQGSSQDPEQIQRRKELASLLTCALDQLPLDQRVAFVLCEVEDRTSREVADITGVPEGTVRTRLHHAKKKLREALSQEGLG
ncbi:MAG: RNA polymerase sigma factor [Myxococcales bacterium]|nr:MAG: RNA polymerase sigma factor [Myxococcales bacterium]